MIDTYGYKYMKNLEKDIEYIEYIEHIKKYCVDLTKAAGIPYYLFNFDKSSGTSYTGYYTYTNNHTEVDYSVPFIKIDPSEYEYPYTEGSSNDKELPDKDLSKILLQLDLS